MKHETISLPFATVDGRALTDALKPIRFVAPRKSTIPILSCVKIAVAGSVMRLSATDLDIEIGIDLDVIDAVGEWEVAINAVTMANIARVARGTDLKLELVARQAGGQTESFVRATVGDGEVIYELPFLDAESYPEMSGERGALVETFSNGFLPALLDRLSPYMSREETRYYLNGIHWLRKDGKTRFAVTDGHRLCVWRGAATEPGDIDWIIPQKTVDLLRTHFGGKDFLAYRCGGTKAEFVTGAVTIRSKLIEETFPDVDRVIPKAEDAAHRFRFSARDLVAGIDRVMAVGGKVAMYGPAIRLFCEDGRLAISRKHPDAGSALSILSNEWPEDASDVGFNARYLRSLLDGCCGQVTMAMKDAGSPVRFGDEDDAYTRVLMPMRV